MSRASTVPAAQPVTSGNGRLSRAEMVRLLQHHAKHVGMTGQMLAGMTRTLLRVLDTPCSWPTPVDLRVRHAARQAADALLRRARTA